MTEQTELKKNLSLFNLIFFGIGIIVGAGIYSVIGVAYGHARGSLWLSFLCSAPVALLTALSYCEVATMYPSAGAESVYLKNAFPEWPIISFFTGLILLIGGTVTSSSVAVAFGGYLKYFFPVSTLGAGAILIFICSLINLAGIKNSNRANLIFTLIEIIGILLIIFLGFSFDHPKGALELRLDSQTMKAASLIFFVYIGFEDIANLAEEVRNPEKNIPKAILISLSVTSILYLLVSIAVIRLVDAQTLSTSSFPLADALKYRAPHAQKILSSIALFSTANTVLGTLLVGSRMLFSVARAGDLPKKIGITSGVHQTPKIAILIIMIFSLTFIFFDNLEFLVSVSSLATLIAFAFVNVCVIRLRLIEKNRLRPFKIPFNVANIPVPAVLGLILTIVLMLEFEFSVYLLTGGLIILICILYRLNKKNFFKT